MSKFYYATHFIFGMTMKTLLLIALLVCSNICVGQSTPVNVNASDGLYDNEIRISWDGSKPNHRVLRNTKNDFKGATQVRTWASSKSFIDKSAVKNTIYYYFIQSSDGTNTNSNLISTAETGFAGKMANFTAKVSADKTTANLSWIKTNQVSTKYTKIFRSDKNDINSGTPIGTWTENSTLSDKPILPGIKYWYYAFVSDKNDEKLKGTFADSASVFIPINGIGNFRAIPNGKNINLTWTGSDLPTYKYIKIFRAETKNPSKATAISQWITNTQFSDVNAIAGIKYYYYAYISETNTNSPGILADLAEAYVPLSPLSFNIYRTGKENLDLKIEWTPKKDEKLYYRFYRNEIKSYTNAKPITNWFTKDYAIRLEISDIVPNYGTRYFYYCETSKYPDGSFSRQSSIIETYAGNQQAWNLSKKVSTDYYNYVRLGWNMISGQVTKIMRAEVNDSTKAIYIPDKYINTVTFDDEKGRRGISYWYWIQTSSYGYKFPSTLAPFGEAVRRLNPSFFNKVSQGTYPDRIYMNIIQGYIENENLDLYHKISRADDYSGTNRVEITGWFKGKEFTDNNIPSNRSQFHYFIQSSRYPDGRNASPLSTGYAGYVKRALGFVEFDNLTLYPMPAVDEINLTSSENFDNSTFLLFDTNNKPIDISKDVQVMDNSRIKINIGNLPYGLYYLKTISVDGKVVIKRLIKGF
jgi:Secretion system C-terminal sorting domain